MSAADRDLLRSLTLGAPPRQMKKKLVHLRDSAKPRALELQLDEEGKPELEPVLDEKKKPTFDDAGAPVMREAKRYRHPPLLKADGTYAQVEVREPGLKTRAAIYRAAGVSADGDNIDLSQLQVEAVVTLTYVPETNVQVFDAKDRPALLAQLAGGFVDDIYEAIGPLMNAAKEEEVAKN